MKNLQEVISYFVIECFIIIFIAIACTLDSLGFALFYNIGYGVLMSIVIPLKVLKAPLSSLGVKPLRFKQYIVLLFFTLFSVGGQLIPIIISGKAIRFDLIAICTLPLIMTTFFEEFLFRGFIQTRLDHKFGWKIAIFFSGLFFSLYHIGYPGFRSLEDLLLLFVVGIGFAVAFKLSDNNLLVAYFVNLPNAIITYILKSEQFPTLTWINSVYSILTIIIVIIIFLNYINKLHLYKNEIFKFFDK